VGLTEKEAIEVHGEAAVESYISSFSPLEWSITEQHTDLSCFAKVVVLKEQNNKVCAFAIVNLVGFLMDVQITLHANFTCART
jgi:pyruvate/2-oxoglutarate dehydrogenase complex dihydrolipoamide dehydrogenase (E3) component